MTITRPAPDFAALIGSRICHDLISPLGAIANGVELLELAGTAEGPELSLVADSVRHATARIRFFRVAFGTADPGHSIGGAEIRSILGEISEDARVTHAWPDAPDLPRAEARAVFLLLLCMETALPMGGRVRIAESGGRHWQITGDGPRVVTDAGLFAGFKGQPPEDAGPAQVQVLLAPAAAAALDRQVSVSATDTRLPLTL